MSINRNSWLVGAPLQDPDPRHKIFTPLAERKEGQHDEKLSRAMQNQISFVLRVYPFLWHPVMETVTLQMCAVSGVHFLTNEKGCWEFYIRLRLLWRMFAHRASKSGSTVQLLLCAPY